MLVSECCNAYPWKLEVYGDRLGICSECKEHSTFIEEEEEICGQ